MDLTIAERLICPRPHEPAPLVIRADVVDAGDLRQGVLGCPVCHTEWPVAAGVARFGDASTLTAQESPDAATVAAFLGIIDPGALIVVDGATAALQAALMNEFGASVVALDPVDSAGAAVAIYGATTVPLAAGGARGALLLRAQRDQTFVESVTRVVAPGARIVGAATLAQTAELTEIARDEHLWIAERERIATPVVLERRRK